MSQKPSHPVFQTRQFLNTTDISLKSSEILILLLLASHAGPCIYPSLKCLASESQLSKRQLIRVLKSLQTKNLIEVIKYESKYGDASAYRLLFLSTPGDMGDTSYTCTRCHGYHRRGAMGDTTVVTSRVFDTYDRRTIEEREKKEHSLSNFYPDEANIEHAQKNGIDLAKEMESFVIKKLPELRKKYPTYTADNKSYKLYQDHFRSWLDQAIIHRKKYTVISDTNRSNVPIYVRQESKIDPDPSPLLQEFLKTRQLNGHGSG
jgi:hypothetical protein